MNKLAVNVTDQTTNTPEYGATVALELHSGEHEEYYVIVSNSNSIYSQHILFSITFLYSKQIFYYFNTYHKRPKQLTIPNCPHPCGLSQFENVFSDVLVYNITQECQLWADAQQKRKKTTFGNRDVLGNSVEEQNFVSLKLKTNYCSFGRNHFFAQ